MNTTRIRAFLSGCVRRQNTLVYNPARCIGCGLCNQVCPHGVFSAPELPSVTVEPEAAPRTMLSLGRVAKRRPVARLVRPDDCMECGACQLNCPSGAIQVDSGVGCAIAMIRAALRGSRDVSCGPNCCGAELPSSAVHSKRRQAEC